MVDDSPHQRGKVSPAIESSSVALGCGSRDNQGGVDGTVN
jgi:hypothetical protein